MFNNNIACYYSKLSNNIIKTILLYLKKLNFTIFSNFKRKLSWYIIKVPSLFNKLNVIKNIFNSLFFRASLGFLLTPSSRSAIMQHFLQHWGCRSHLIETQVSRGFEKTSLK